MGLGIGLLFKQQTEKTLKSFFIRKIDRKLIHHSLLFVWWQSQDFLCLMFVIYTSEYSVEVHCIQRQTAACRASIQLGMMSQATRLSSFKQAQRESILSFQKNTIHIQSYKPRAPIGWPSGEGGIDSPVLRIMIAKFALRI